MYHSTQAVGIVAVGLALSSQAIAASQYTWPAASDDLEDLLAMHEGYIRFGFSDLVVPCEFGSGTVGTQNAGEWVRTAFHDMATFDKEAGIGGLDGSLQYELDRKENTGTAFNNTFGAMHDFITPRTSVSDLLALSVVSAVTACGGPRIPLRTGRKDALMAGVAGVPKPEDDLVSTRNTFVKAGFNTEDMIALVACGHTLGNIHSVDHPDLFPGQTPSQDKVARFDSTFNKFDNVVVTEYLDGSTANPLVVAENATLRSDHRIFSSDGNNATMAKMADPAVFQSTCARVFEQMLDSVPSTTTLSDPIEIVDFKPYIDPMTLQPSSNTLRFKGRVRVRDHTTADNIIINGDDLTIELQYRDHSGAAVSQPIQAPRARIRGGQSRGFFDNVFTWFEFDTSLDATAAISGFDIHVQIPSTGKSFMLNNAGAVGGYPVDTDVVFQLGESCMVNNGTAMELSITAAVRKDSPAAAAAPQLRVHQKRYTQGVLLPRLEAEEFPFVPVSKNANETVPGYEYFRAHGHTSLAGWSTRFDVVAGGKALEMLRTNSLGSSCPSS